MGRRVADPALLAAESAAAPVVYKPVVVRYYLYIPWQGHISNKVSHEYAAGVGPSCQIPLKKELRVQVKPFFLRFAMHYYQFNIGDYQSHTSHLSDMEDLAYRRLLDWCYLHEKPLPKDIDEIARLIRMRSHSDCIANVLREFFKLLKGGYVSERVIYEVGQVNVKSEKAKASAKARWGNKINDLGDNANAMRTHSERNATHNPLPNTHNPLKELAPKAAQSTRLADDWQLPDDWAIWAKENRPELNLNQIADGFKDYWIAQPGAKGRKADWFATWRNWIRTQKLSKQDKVYESPWQKAARLRMAEFAPGVAAKDPNAATVIDMEFFNKPQEIKNGTSNSSD